LPSGWPEEIQRNATQRAQQILDGYAQKKNSVQMDGSELDRLQILMPW
jgi:hypothetical protein